MVNDDFHLRRSRTFKQPRRKIYFVPLLCAVSQLLSFDNNLLLTASLRWLVSVCVIFVFISFNFVVLMLTIWLTLQFICRCFSNKLTSRSFINQSKICQIVGHLYATDSYSQNCTPSQGISMKHFVSLASGARICILF